MKKNNKILYEKIMRNIAKQVKRALNESEELNITLEDIEDRIKNASDGIYIADHDHLRMDAWDVYVVRDHSFEKYHYVMLTDSDYYHSTGLINGIRQLRDENPDLNVYYCDVIWRTFPMKYYICDDDGLERMMKRINADAIYDIMNDMHYKSRKPMTVQVDDEDTDNDEYSNFGEWEETFYDEAFSKK